MALIKTLEIKTLRITWPAQPQPKPKPNKLPLLLLNFLKGQGLTIEFVKTLLRAVYTLGLVSAVASCTIPPGSDSGDGNALDWRSTLYVDHALVGQIFDVRNQAFVTYDELVQRVQGASYLLLGEKHDNPDHHTLQLAVVEQLLDLGKIKLVSFEMLGEESQEKLLALSEQRFTNENELKAYLDWDDQGWDWQFYGPLVQQARLANIPIRAGNISRSRMSEVYGDESLAQQWAFLGEDVVTRLNQDIDASHCGMLPESQFPAMVRVQQARDEAMAKSLLAPANEGLAVLIAGNYHVRHDLGVPNYLINETQELDRSDIVSLSFSEVAPLTDNALEYLESTAGQAAHDYVWFTPAVSNEDYCASMRQGAE